VIFTDFLCMLPMAVARSSSVGGDEIPRGRGNFGVFFPTDNAVYSIAFGTRTKTAEQIKMPLRLMTRVGPSTMC